MYTVEVLFSGEWFPLADGTQTEWADVWAAHRFAVRTVTRRPEYKGKLRVLGTGVKIVY